MSFAAYTRCISTILNELPASIPKLRGCLSKSNVILQQGQASAALSSCSYRNISSASSVRCYHHMPAFGSSMPICTYPKYRSQSKRIVAQSPMAQSQTCRLNSTGGSSGSQQFLEFLKKEIEVEKKDKGSLPQVTGFKAETSGPNVKLVRTHGDENVTVEFNVNNTVSSVGDEDGSTLPEDNSDISAPEMISSPPFTVTLSKSGSPHSLSVRCEFIDDTLMSDDVKADEDADSYEIVEVSMINKEWSDNSYSISSEILDGTMYDLLMLMLEERGINHTEFCDELVNFSTTYEQSLYIDMLTSMKDFLSKN